MIFKKFFNNLINFIYPRKCVFCQEVIPIKETDFICKECFFNIDLSIPPKNSIFFILPYSENVKNSIHRFKYYNRPDYAKVFASLIYSKLLFYEINFDIICYVPMHFSKKKKRGYDQAYLLAYHLSLVCGRPICNDLIRTRNTTPQSKVSAQNRKSNVLGAFYLNDYSNIYNKDVLLIDDIFTTGSTIFQCREQLLNAKPKSVTLLTFSKVQ